MKKKSFYYSLFLFILIFSQINIQASTYIDCVIFHESIAVNSTFEWTIEKYIVEERPEPEAHKFFIEGDIIKAKIIKNPPSELECWEDYFPEANFSDWIQFYKNDVVFETSSTGNLSTLFDFCFLYPISWVEDNVTSSYFEEYTTIAVDTFAPSIMDYELTTKLGKDYCTIEYDFTCKRCLNKHLISRIYNIHTGVLSKFRYTYDNEYNNIYEIIITNPEDKAASFSLVAPLVTFFVIGVIYTVRRKWRHKR